MGEDVNTECSESLPLTVRLRQAPLFRADGSRFRLDEMDKEFVQKRVFTWRKRNGVITDERFYSWGSKEYQREKWVAKKVVALLEKIRAAEQKLLFKVTRVEFSPGCFGQALINLQYSDVGHFLRGHDNRILVPEWTAPISATGKQMEHNGKYTISQVDVNGCGIFRGSKVHFGLCGIVMNVNTACSQCCTHTSVNWGYGLADGLKQKGFKQRWYQLLPGKNPLTSRDGTN